MKETQLVFIGGGTESGYGLAFFNTKKADYLLHTLISNAMGYILVGFQTVLAQEMRI